jgi:hypothetical protein
MTIVNIIDKPSLEDMVRLENIKVDPDISRITNRLRFTTRNSLTRSRIHDLLTAMLAATEPEAVYKTSSITARTNAGLEIDGIPFSYPLLRFNLDKASQIFPFIVTAGDLIGPFNSTSYQPDELYCLDIIKDLVLDETLKYLQTHLMRKFHLSYIWSLKAGEMQAWPLSGQKGLFEVLGNAGEEIGVRLQPDFTLLPVYSRSGFFYYADTEFEGCQVCSKEPCMMRRAQYNDELAGKKGLRIRKVCGKETA